MTDPPVSAGAERSQSASVKATLGDARLAAAVSQIRLRSERQPDPASLERTYVETGVLAQLDNPNSQILFGRRGTGKSHVLQVLALRRARQESTRAVYIDMRLLGSARTIADPDRPLAIRCINLFKDVLLAIWEDLLESATDPEWDASDDALQRVQELGDAITEISRVAHERQISTSLGAISTQASGIEASLDLANLSVHGGKSTTATSDATLAASYKEVLEANIYFSDIAKLADNAFEALGIRELLLLIDEWTAIPTEIQPLLAEFLKKSLMPSARVTVKVASLEYRSRFSDPVGQNNVVGFEVGGDISAILDLDDYYVYDRYPDQVVAIFEELLFKHVDSELPERYLKEAGIENPNQFRQRLFSEKDTFVELVRASEGVVRDFINIFNAAFFDAKRRGRGSIDVKAVREAARKWYETDKAVNLSSEQHRVLERIMTEVIGNKRARSFLLAREHARHPMTQSLFDFRVLHLMSKG